MWTNGNGSFYEGDCLPGDRLATQQEVDGWVLNNQKMAQRAQIKAQFTDTISIKAAAGDPNAIAMAQNLMAQLDALE